MWRSGLPIAPSESCHCSRPKLLEMLVLVPQLRAPELSRTGEADKTVAVTCLGGARRRQTKHVLGSVIYGVRARELAAGDDARVGHEEIQIVISSAPPALHEVVRRMPACSRGRSRLDELLCILYERLCR